MAYMLRDYKPRGVKNRIVDAFLYSAVYTAVWRLSEFLFPPTVPQHVILTVALVAFLSHLIGAWKESTSD